MGNKSLYGSFVRDKKKLLLKLSNLKNLKKIENVENCFLVSKRQCQR